MTRFEDCGPGFKVVEFRRLKVPSLGLDPGQIYKRVWPDMHAMGLSRAGRQSRRSMCTYVPRRLYRYGDICRRSRHALASVPIICGLRYVTSQLGVDSPNLGQVPEGSGEVG